MPMISGDGAPASGPPENLHDFFAVSHLAHVLRDS
jgi:hypothetical protein